MIPKKIHYFWFGNKNKSILANICINSWREKLSDFELIEWNETNLDIKKLCNENRFFNECYRRKLYAFMVDYLRLKVLYEYGGIYMDTDVQVIKDFSDLTENSAFIGKEVDDYIGTGVIGCEPNNLTVKRILDFYDQDIWKSQLFTIPHIVTEIFTNEGKGNFTVYPMEYFAPYDYNKSFEYSLIRENTYAIHWFGSSWTGKLSNLLFLQTKNIDNRLKKFPVMMKKTLGYYNRKLKKKV